MKGIGILRFPELENWTISLSVSRPLGRVSDVREAGVSNPYSTRTVVVLQVFSPDHRALGSRLEAIAKVWSVVKPPCTHDGWTGR